MTIYLLSGNMAYILNKHVVVDILDNLVNLKKNKKKKEFITFD